MSDREVKNFHTGTGTNITRFQSYTPSLFYIIVQVESQWSDNRTILSYFLTGNVPVLLCFTGWERSGWLRRDVYPKTRSR